MGELAFDRPGDPGHNDKASLSSFQPFDNFVVVKPFVGADKHGPDSRRDLGEAGPEEVQDTAGSVNVSWTKLPMPEVLRLPFETKQRVIRWSSVLDGVVTNPCFFLFSVDHKDCGIHVEDEAPGWMGLGDHLCQEPIVKLAQLGQGLGRHAQQESSEGAGIGIGRQSAQISKDPIGLQQLRGLDAFETKDDGIENRQQQLAHTVAIVALAQTDLHRHRIFETDASQKTVEQIDATVMREALAAEGNSEFSGSFWHYSEPYLLGSFHWKQGKSTLASQNWP